MAYITSTHPVAGPFFNRVATAFANFRQARLDNRMFRKTLSELRTLSSRELNDLGLSRSSLYEVARASVYKG